MFKLFNLEKTLSNTFLDFELHVRTTCALKREDAISFKETSFITCLYVHQILTNLALLLIPREYTKKRNSCLLPQ